MSQQWMRPILEMLDAAGCQQVKTGGDHLKYRLPNGRLFIASSTPSSPSAVDNALARLRRELRITHPEVAAMGRSGTLPKEKRFGSTIGDQLANKGITIEAALPGSQPADFFQIVDDAVTIQGTDTNGGQLEFDRSYVPARRRYEPQPRATVRTMTEFQVNRANVILRENGQEAMNEYIASCELVEATAEPRHHEPTILSVTAPPQPTTEDRQMTSMLDRARHELQETTLRLSSYAEQLATIKASEEKDVMRQAQLEQYIKRHEELAAEAASLLSDGILPPEPVIQLRKHDIAPESKRRTYAPRLPFNAHDARNKIYPVLYERYPVFTFDNLFTVVREVYGIDMTRDQASNLLHSEVRDNPRTVIERVAPGVYRFKKQGATNGEAQPVYVSA